MLFLHGLYSVNPFGWLARIDLRLSLGECRNRIVILLVGWSVTNDGQTVWRVMPCANRITYANVTLDALGSIVYWPQLEIAETTHIDAFRHTWIYGESLFYPLPLSHNLSLLKKTCSFC